MPIPLLAAVLPFLSSAGGAIAGGLGAAGSGALGALGSLGSGLGAVGSAVGSSPIGSMAAKFGASKFGGAALKGLGSSFGSNVGSQLFGQDNSEEEALLRSLQNGTPQIATNSISSGVFQAPSIGRRFN